MKPSPSAPARTPKQRVLRKWPEAVCRSWYINSAFRVWRDELESCRSNRGLGVGSTARQAWADAARNLTRRKP